MTAKENGLYFIAILGALLAAACATSQVKYTPPVDSPITVAVALPPPVREPVAAVVVHATRPDPAKSALVVHIQSKLGDLKPGMSRSQVEHMLRLDSEFQGIVNSEGTRDDFGYFYDLGDWELILRFSYRTERDGAFMRYKFGPVPAT
ncbi:MAG: hypothetical protein J0L75_20350 [Spirochaetes bacterium]|nr:hypothetical protein [Spirochaetota bacterium]